MPGGVSTALLLWTCAGVRAHLDDDGSLQARHGGGGQRREHRVCVQLRLDCLGDGYFKHGRRQVEVVAQQLRIMPRPQQGLCTAHAPVSANATPQPTRCAACRTMQVPQKRVAHAVRANVQLEADGHEHLGRHCRRRHVVLAPAPTPPRSARCGGARGLASVYTHGTWCLVLAMRTRRPGVRVRGGGALLPPPPSSSSSSSSIESSDGVSSLWRSREYARLSGSVCGAHAWRTGRSGGRPASVRPCRPCCSTGARCRMSPERRHRPPKTATGRAGRATLWARPLHLTSVKGCLTHTRDDVAGTHAPWTSRRTRRWPLRVREKAGASRSPCATDSVYAGSGCSGDASVSAWAAGGMDRDRGQHTGAPAARWAGGRGSGTGSSTTGEASSTATAASIPAALKNGRG
jgi:hypothetical protein